MRGSKFKRPIVSSLTAHAGLIVVSSLSHLVFKTHNSRWKVHEYHPGVHDTGADGKANKYTDDRKFDRECDQLVG